MSKGGTRPGSGRPRKDPTVVRMTKAFRLLPTTVGVLEKMATERGETTAQVVESLIMDARDERT